MKAQYFFKAILLATLITGCASAPKKEEQAFVNDFPTAERIDYALSCIAKHGGLTYITQYKCACKVDKLAEKINFKDYDAARTFTFLRSTPGEKGAAFRDPKRGKDLRKFLKQAEKYAEENCFAR